MIVFAGSVPGANPPSPRPIEQSALSGRQNVSVVFSAADLSNPESVFGHVFIVFHDGNSPGPLDPVVEFYGMMAEVEMGMLKTITSSIPGIYKLATFEEKVRVYDKEGRDLFVRRVRASIDPESLSARVNRLSKEVHPYDFLDRNCAFYLEYLLTSSSTFHDSSWAIRQPADVFYEYGDPSSEYVIKSTERNRIEFKQAVSSEDLNPEAREQIDRGLRFYEARSVVLAGSVGTGLDSAASTLFNSAPPPSVYPPPMAEGDRKYAVFAISDMHVLAQYGGFDTRALSLGDSVPSLSRLKVGEVTLSCEKGFGCVSQVLAFETLTLPKEGLGLSKFLSTSGRVDNRGIGLNAQIGMGLGYRVKSFGIAIIPGLAIDTKQWGKRDSLADGLLANRVVATYNHKESSTYFDLSVADSKKVDAINDSRRSFRITFERLGLFAQTSFSDGFLIGIQRRFD